MEWIYKIPIASILSFLKWTKVNFNISISLLLIILIISSLWVIRTYYPPVPYADKMIRDAIEKFMELGISLEDAPDYCDKQALSRYREADNLIKLIRAYAPHTSAPDIYLDFVRHNAHLLIFLPGSCEKKH